MSNDLTPFIPVLPYPTFPVHYIPLPAYYPKLPLSPLELQPAAYTQGDGHKVYVTLLIPLSGGLEVLPLKGITLEEREDGHTYICHIHISGNLQPENAGRLAITSFSFVPCQHHYKLEIQVHINGQEDDLGKVVMDSNMLPTQED